jgi:hypothetical protein
LIHSATGHAEPRRQEIQQRPPPQAAAFPVIQGYRFLQTIARSPKSEIHVAHSMELGHNVAIKCCAPGRCPNRRQVKKSASSASATC